MFVKFLTFLMFSMSNIRKYTRGFRRLVVWQEAHSLTLEIYKMTSSFPKEEKFGITSQLRRASSSIGANIAEGSSRNTAKDQNLFYSIARSSLVEVDNFLELAHDLSYLNNAQYQKLVDHLNKIAYLLSQLINRKPYKR